MEPSRYFTLTTGLVFVVGAMLMTLATDVHDYTGSQTRTGGYLETDFAPIKPQEIFPLSMFKSGEGAEDYDQYYDMVVIGDSFSQSPSESWVNFVARDLRASAIVFHIDVMDFEALVKNPVFQEYPPKHVLLQSSEGDAFLRLGRLVHLSGLTSLETHAPIAAERVYASVEKSKTKTVPHKFLRSADLRTRLGIAGHYVKSAIKRAVFGERVSDVFSLDVDCDTCFSHPNSKKVLVSIRDLDPQAYKFHLKEQAVAGVLKLSKLIETNCRTRLNTIIFPNKTNVYSRYLSVDTPSVFDGDLPVNDLHLINVRDALVGAVDLGVMDVYPAHDHHTSAVGYSIAALEVSRTLLEQDRTDICSPTKLGN